MRQSSIEKPATAWGISLWQRVGLAPVCARVYGPVKTHLIRKEVNRLKKSGTPCTMSGIAADEPNRIKGETISSGDQGITEAEALRICCDWGLTGAVCIRYITAVPVVPPLSNGSGR